MMEESIYVVTEQEMIRLHAVLASLDTVLQGIELGGISKLDLDAIL